MNARIRLAGIKGCFEHGLPFRQPAFQRRRIQSGSPQQSQQTNAHARTISLLCQRRELQQQTAFRQRRSVQLGDDVGCMVQGFKIFPDIFWPGLLADIHQVEPDLAAMVEQLAAALQHQRRFMELEPRAHGGLRELEEMPAFVQQHRVVDFVSQPGVDAQLARRVIFSFGVEGNVQVEIGRQRHDLARHGWFVSRDQHQVDVGHAAEERFLGQQGAGQVSGDDVLVVVGPLLGGFFGNTDERFYV